MTGRITPRRKVRWRCTRSLITIVFCLSSWTLRIGKCRTTRLLLKRTYNRSVSWLPTGGTVATHCSTVGTATVCSLSCATRPISDIHGWGTATAWKTCAERADWRSGWAGASGDKGKVSEKAAPHSRMEWWTPIRGETAHQQFLLGRIDNRRALQGTVGDWDLLPQHQATAEDKELHRHITQHRENTDLDGLDDNAGFMPAQTNCKIQMGFGKPCRFTQA